MDKQKVPSYDHALPLVDQDHVLQGGFFYKTLQRSSHSETQSWRCRLGLKVYRCQQFQIDHLVFLVQLFNQHLSWCQLLFLDNRFLFIETQIDFSEGQQEQFSFIRQQRMLFSTLQSYSKMISKLVQEQLNTHNFLSKSFDQQIFKEKIGRVFEEMEKEFKGGKIC